jgi:hypothetical protein
MLYTCYTGYPATGAKQALRKVSQHRDQNRQNHSHNRKREREIHQRGDFSPAHETVEMNNLLNQRGRHPRIQFMARPSCTGRLHRCAEGLTNRLKQKSQAHAVLATLP